jgi:hypothetical protein
LLDFLTSRSDTAADLGSIFVVAIRFPSMQVYKMPLHCNPAASLPNILNHSKLSAEYAEIAEKTFSRFAFSAYSAVRQFLHDQIQPPIRPAHHPVADF